MVAVQLTWIYSGFSVAGHAGWYFSWDLTRYGGFDSGVHFDRPGTRQGGRCSVQGATNIPKNTGRLLNAGLLLANPALGERLEFSGTAT